MFPAASLRILPNPLGTSVTCALEEDEEVDSFWRDLFVGESSPSCFSIPPLAEGSRVTTKPSFA